MDLSTLERLYVSQLKELHSAEQQHCESIARMLDYIQNPEFNSLLKSHLISTKQHELIIRNILKDAREYDASDENSNSMECLVDEMEDLIEDNGVGDELDASLLLLTHKMEQFEVSAYTSLLTYSRVLNYTTQEALLLAILKEETEQAKSLSRLLENILLLKHH